MNLRLYYHYDLNIHFYPGHKLNRDNVLIFLQFYDS